MAALKAVHLALQTARSALKATLKSSKTLISLGIGTALTIILLAWAFRDVSFAAVWQAFQQANWGWMGLGWVAYLLSYGVRARRWQTLMSATDRQGRFQTYLAATFVGFGASSVLPGYAGEVIRAAIPARLDRVPFEAAFGSIFAERILDLGVVFLYLLLPIWGNALPAGALHHLPLGWVGAAILLTWLCLLGLASVPQFVVRLVAKLCQLLGLGRFQTQLVTSVQHFLDGLGALRQPRLSAIALLETMLIWGLNAVTYWAGLLAFGMVAPAPAPGFPGALFIQSATALAIILPSTPGYVGAFEAGIRFALGLYRVPIDLILAYALALRAVMFIATPLIGLAVGVKLGLSRAELFAPQGRR
jgi:glycosyltransferase 2 family protein